MRSSFLVNMPYSSSDLKLFGSMQVKYWLLLPALLSVPLVQCLPSDLISEIFESSSECAEGAHYRCVAVDRCVPDVAVGLGLESSSLRQGFDQLEKECICCKDTHILPEEKVVQAGDCRNFQGHKCVPNQECRDGQILSDGQGILRVRGGVVSLDAGLSKCSSDLEVCCLMSDGLSEPLSADEDERDIPESYVSTCGHLNNDGVLINVFDKERASERDTQFGQFPHMCFVLKRNFATQQSVFLCGASLVAPSMLITAAHYVNDTEASELIVRCGDWDLKQEIEPLNHVEHSVQRITVHPSYDPNAVHNDVALLHTSSAFPLQPHIGPVCLPSGQVEYDSEECIATGWGKDSYGDEGAYQSLLQKSILPLVDHEECERLLRKTRLGSNFRLDESFLCAGGRHEGQDTCTGDGGGPLICPIKKKKEEEKVSYVQVGIVSWGLECGVKNQPGVYASLHHARCFVQFASKCFQQQPLDMEEECQNFVQDTRNTLASRKRRLQRQIQAFPQYQKALREKLQIVEQSAQNLENLAQECQMDFLDIRAGFSE